MISPWPDERGRALRLAALTVAGALLAAPAPAAAQPRQHATGPAARVLTTPHGRLTVIAGAARADRAVFFAGRRRLHGGLLPPAGRAAGQPGPDAQKKYKLTITVVERNGQPDDTQVDLVDPSVANGDLGTVATPGGTGSVELPAGRYLVGAGIFTGPLNNPTSLTAVEQTVRVGAAAPNQVTLDARAGKLVDVTLHAPAGPGSQFASVAYRGTRSGWVEAAGGAPGQLYVVPVQGAGFTFGVQTVFPGKNPAARTQYDLAAVTRGRVPTDPVYHYQAGRLARVRAVFRALDAPSSGDAGWVPDGVPLSAIPFGSPPMPGAATYYLSPGIPFSTLFDYGPPGSSENAEIVSGDHRYAAGSSSTQVWNRAVVGPGQAATLASRTGDTFTYPVDGQFSDAAPVSQRHDGVDSAASVTVTLQQGSTVIGSGTFQEQPGELPPTFTATLPASPGDYTLTSATQRHASYARLSTSVTSVWHFRSAHTAARRALPLLAVRYPVPGLNGENQAPAGSALAIPVYLTQARGAAPLAVRTITVAASADGGHSWHQVPLRRAGGHWIAEVTSPPAGFVSLRAAVTARGGTSAVQTIIDAYAVAG